MYVNILVAILNLILCFSIFFYFLNKRRLICINWFLFLYFAIFFIDVAFSDGYTVRRGFDGGIFKVTEINIRNSLIYTLVFNILFFISYAILNIFRGDSKQERTWILSSNFNYRYLSYLLWSFWLIGGGLYVLKASGQSYRDYVEGSGWAIVFFWASSPLIPIYAMLEKKALSLILCIPFIYCAIRLNVRSFALLSIVPFFIVQFYQLINSEHVTNKFLKLIKFGSAATAILVGISIFISQHKNGSMSFPDSNMPHGVSQVMAATDRYEYFTGFDGLILYGWNYINPFMRLFSVPKPNIEDNPVVIARLFEGVPQDWPVYFHYPATLWSDTYISFGWNGLYLAIFWAAVVFFWETVMHKFPNMLALLLPYFVWHNYMWVRGAIAIASVPISYAFYFSFIAFALGLRSGLLKTSLDNPTLLGTDSFNSLPSIYKQ